MDARIFPLGSVWGGMLPREEWANDFAEMRKAGLNAVRFYSGFPGSDPRIKYWEDTDHIVELARGNGIGILYTIGTITLPREFFAKYPDIRFIDIDGKPFPRNIEDLTWPQACFNHPGYRQEIAGFMEMLVGHYRDNPAILCWTVHNEPCNPWGGTGCYCPHTIKVFQGWLRDRYGGDLGRVNQLWETGYASWDAVQPPRKWPFDGGNASAWMDWMTFGEWNVTDFIRWEAEIVRRLDPSRPVGTNTMGGVGLPITTAQSERELARVLDFIGIDWYPSWILHRRHGEKAQMEKYVGALLDMTRWAVGDKPAIVMEVQAGPNAESIWFGADEMRIEGWQSIAHNMKGIYYYRWDPLVSGAEPWVHHMRTVNGEITDRVDEAGRLARQVGHVVNLIAGSAPPRSPVAMFYSRPSKIMAEADGLYYPQFTEANRGVYRLLADNHYGVDFIDGEEVLAGKLAGYRALLLPFTYCLSREVADAIKAFVRQGGIVLAEPFCAARDEQAVPYGETPGAGLAELFGVKATSTVKYHYWLVAHCLEMSQAGAAATGVKEGIKFWFCGVRETLELLNPGAQVLAEFIDFPPYQGRSPAVVVNGYGQGKAVYFAAGLGEAYVKMETPELRHMVDGLLRSLGVPKAVEVADLSDEASQDLEITVLDAKDEPDRTVIVINHAGKEAEATFRIQVRQPERLRVRELVSFRALDARMEDGRLVVQATVPARDAAVLNIYQLPW
jgi:beta-galactosidase GanA